MARKTLESMLLSSRIQCSVLMPSSLGVSLSLGSDNTQSLVGQGITDLEHDGIDIGGVHETLMSYMTYTTGISQAVPAQSQARQPRSASRLQMTVFIYVASP